MSRVRLLLSIVVLLLVVVSRGPLVVELVSGWLGLG